MGSGVVFWLLDALVVASWPLPSTELPWLPTGEALADACWASISERFYRRVLSYFSLGVVCDFLLPFYAQNYQNRVDKELSHL